MDFELSGMFRAGTISAICTALLVAACGGESADQTDNKKPAPSVITVAVQTKDVSAALEYVGRSQASHRVEIRARVSGVLLERPFKEGDTVKKDALLFAIDPAEFEANKASAEAEIARIKAQIEETSANLARYQELLKRDVASVQKFDEAKAKDGQARASLAAAEAALKKAELDLGYTRILTPIDGRSGIANADVGNLIGPDSGVLVTVLKLDPIRIYFSIGEREYLNYRQNAQPGEGVKLTPRIRLANGKIYPKDGTFDLADNEVDAATGTLRIRINFPNPDGLIVPGQFVNVILTSTAPSQQVVIPQVSIQENQSGPFVLVVDKDNRVEQRPIKTGQRIGAEIVALEGLTAGETIIVEGIQKVRPGVVVAPTPQTTTPAKAAAGSGTPPATASQTAASPKK